MLHRYTIVIVLNNLAFPTLIQCHLGFKSDTTWREIHWSYFNPQFPQNIVLSQPVVPRKIGPTVAVKRGGKTFLPR